MDRKHDRRPVYAWFGNGGKMHTDLSIEWNIAREKRQDWLRQGAQERLIRAAKAERGSSTKVNHQWSANLRMWFVRRRAVI